jgi:serine/threonine-protein phosphatase PP1 catalytic subunit
MCVSEELLCSFELLKPLDASALKQHMKKGDSKKQYVTNFVLRVMLTTVP